MEQQRVLGLSACISLVVGNMIGSGIFLLPASLASIGSISILAWIITTIGSLLLAMVFGKLSQQIPVTGGPYAYCKKGLGNFAGYQVNLSYLLANIVGDAATVVALLAYLSVFWPAMNTNHLLAFMFGSAIIWLIAAINILGVRQVKIVQVTTTVIKLIPVLLVAFTGLFHMDIAHFHSFNMTENSNVTALANAAMLTLFAFGGLESSTVPAANIKDPQKTIYRATMIGTLITGLIYVLSTVAIMGMFAMKDLANDSAPFASAGRVIFGALANDVFAAAAIIACVSTIIGFLFITGQAAMAAANDGLLPKFLAKLSKWHTPYWAFIVSALIMNIVLGMNYNEHLTNQFTVLVTLSNLFVLIPYLYSSVTELKITREPKYILIASLACLYILFAIIGTGRDAIFYGVVLLFVLTPFYSLMKDLK